MGFPRFSTAILAKAKAEWGHPDVAGTLSTWHFQLSTASPPVDEYGGLDKWLRARRNYSNITAPTGQAVQGRVRRAAGGSHPSPHDAASAVESVEWTHTMSAVEGGFDWLAAHGGTVGGLPVLDFPEYSMFGRCPWGGFGANPIPMAMQADWDR